MIEERYARYLEELKTTFFERLNDWEKTFVQDVSSRQFLTIGQKTKIKDIIDQQNNPKPNGPRQPEYVSELVSEDKRIYVSSSRDGWQFHVDRTPVGEFVSLKDAKTILAWLETALPAIQTGSTDAPAGDEPPPF